MLYGSGSASLGFVLAAAAQQRLIDACGKPFQGDVGPIPGNAPQHGLSLPLLETHLLTAHLRLAHLYSSSSSSPMKNLQLCISSTNIILENKNKRLHLNEQLHDLKQL